MRKLIVTRGVSASGKTTWAKEHAKNCNHPVVIVSRDDIRWDIMKDRGLVPCWKNWSWKDEGLVNKIRSESIEDVLSVCEDLSIEDIVIVLCDTNLKAHYFEEECRRFYELGWEVEIKRFDVSWEEAVERDLNREHPVGSSVLAKQFKSFYGETYKPADTVTCYAYIFDIDGTVAHRGDRSPFDWDRVSEDTPDIGALNVAVALSAFKDARVIFLSGRSAECFDATHSWIKEHSGLNDDQFMLIMRAEGDKRNDSIVKREMFDRDIRPNYRVLGVFDDRPSVCRMWRQMGLRVFQVGDPYVEF